MTESSPGTASGGAMLRRAFLAAAALLCTAAVWDVVARMFDVPTWWSAVSFVGVAAGVVLGLLAVLAQVLTQPGRGRPVSVTALRMTTLGVLLGAWLLRGDSGIPADPPIVVAEVAAAAVFALSLLRAR